MSTFHGRLQILQVTLLTHRYHRNSPPFGAVPCQTQRCPSLVLPQVMLMAMLVLRMLHQAAETGLGEPGGEGR